MLQLMLHAHSRIAIPPETRFLLTGYERLRSWGDLADATNRRRLADWIVDDTSTLFADLGLDPDAVRAEIVAGPPTLGSAIGIVFRAYARRFDKPRWGDKRPMYLQQLDVVMRLFPDAQIVHIVRDGRDCAASLKEMPWYSGGVYQAIANWNRGMDQGRRAARMLGPGSYYEISYERLVRDPAPELQLLCAFLGEEYDPAMQQPHEMARIAVPTRKSWHALTHSEPTTDRIGSWKQRLEPWEIGLCESLMGERLRSRGYEVGGDHSPGLTHRVMYVQQGTRARLAFARTALTERYHRRRPPIGIAALLTSAELGRSMAEPIPAAAVSR
jgi:sulfotransferase family protein